MDHVEIWKKYEEGQAFNNSIRLLENVETNENFYIGKQWEGVKSNGLPTPVFNMLKQIVQHQVASITSDNIKMNASPLAASANDRELETLCRVVNDEFAALFERNRLTTLIREYTEKHALDRSFLYFIQSPYLEEDVKQIAETTARELGFRATEWIKTGCVITCHGGPGAVIRV